MSEIADAGDPMRETPSPRPVWEVFVAFLVQGLTALQGLDDHAIAAVGGGAWPPVAGQDQGVGVQPFDGLLALGQHEIGRAHV